MGLGCVKTFWAVAELGETHLNNAEQAQFDALFVASLELILRLLSRCQRAGCRAALSAAMPGSLPGAALRS
jgi:hypothetical protein